MSRSKSVDHVILRLVVGFLVFLAGFFLLFYGAVRYRTTVRISAASEEAVCQAFLDSNSLSQLAKNEWSKMAVHLSKQIAYLDGSFLWTFEALLLCSMGLIAALSGVLFTCSIAEKHFPAAHVRDSVSRQRYGMFVVGLHSMLFALLILVAYTVDTLRALAFGTWHMPFFVDFGWLIARWTRICWALFLPLLLADYFLTVRALESDRVWPLWMWRDGILWMFVLLVLYCFCGVALFICYAFF